MHKNLSSDSSAHTTRIDEDADVAMIIDPSHDGDGLARAAQDPEFMRCIRREQMGKH